jgi:hypothetical protein
MRQHLTFTKVSDLNHEATTWELRHAVDTYLNQLFPEHTILAITESWTPAHRFNITIWVEWKNDAPLPPIPEEMREINYPF